MSETTLDGTKAVLIHLILENKPYWVRTRVQKETKTQLTVLNRRYNKATGNLLGGSRFYNGHAAYICEYDESKDQRDEYNAHIATIETRAQIKVLLDTLTDKLVNGELDASLDKLKAGLEEWN